MAFRAFAPSNTQGFMQEGGGGPMQQPHQDFGSEVKTNLKFIPVNFGKKTPVKHRQAWSEEEQARFLEGVTKYHRNWQKVTEHVGTKTAKQVRSHAQKYFLKYPDAAVAILLPPPRPCRHQAREAVGAPSSGGHYPVDARDVATAAAVLQAGTAAPNPLAPSIAAYHNFPAQQASFPQHMLQSQLPQLTPQQLSVAAAAAAQHQQAQQQAVTNKLLPSAIVPSPQGRKMSPVPPLSWHMLGSSGPAPTSGSGSGSASLASNNRLFSPVTLMSAAPAASHSPPPTPRLSVTSLLSPETESVATATLTPSASCPSPSVPSSTYTSSFVPSSSAPSSSTISSALAASLNATSGAAQPGTFYSFPAAASGAMPLASAPTLSPSAYSSGSAAFVPSVPTSST